MKKIAIIFFILGLPYLNAFAQQTKMIRGDFGFEKSGSNRDSVFTWVWRTDSNFRINRDSIEKHSGEYSLLLSSENGGSGTFAITNVPIACEGQNMTLKAYLRLEDVMSSIGLMLRIDVEQQVLQFTNMMERGVSGTRDWTEYEVSLPLPKRATSVAIGVILSSKGRLWVDDFSLLIDGNDYRQASTKEIVEDGDEDAKLFKDSSNIDIESVTEFQINSLCKLAKVWGMMKYYHTNVAKGDYQWDYELFKIMPEILKAESNEKVNSLLFRWVHQFGELQCDFSKKMVSNKMKKSSGLDLSWTKDEMQFGSKICYFMDSLKNAIRVDPHYYVTFSKDVCNPNFINEESYSHVNCPDAGYRLLSLFRYWNIVEYTFPYKHLIDNWDSVLVEFISKFISAKYEKAYQLTVFELITKINDTHATLSHVGGRLNDIFGAYYAPFEISFVENRAVVTTVLNDEMASHTNLKMGDIIIKINDKSVEEFVKQMRDITPASNDAVRFRNIAANLVRCADTVLYVEYNQDGKIKNDSVLCHTSYLKSVSDGISHKLLTKDIGYINMDALTVDSIDTVMNDLKCTKGIIIDLRCYPDYLLYDICKYFMPEPTDFAKVIIGGVGSIGDFYEFGNLKIGEENKDYYKGKVVIIVNEKTQSLAEFTVMAFQKAPKAVVLGNTTAGADGDVSMFYLPGGLMTTFSGIGICYPNHLETQQLGIKIDIEVKPTIQGIKEGRDELLEAAIKAIDIH